MHLWIPTPETWKETYIAELHNVWQIILYMAEEMTEFLLSKQQKHALKLGWVWHN